MGRINRRVFLGGAATPFIHVPGKAARERPNVLIFMTDDHGAWATGAYGCPSILTPNLDVLAAGGVRFTRAYAATPVCSPSRMTYMTGRLPSTHGVQDWLRPVDSFGEKSRRWLEGQPTWSEALAKAGYHLGMVGKWHMGHDEWIQAGFEHWRTIPGGGGRYKDPKWSAGHGRRMMTIGYKTDQVGDRAIDFLTHAKEPFGLLVPFYAPHTPYNYQPERYREPYANSKFPCFPDEPMNPWQNPGLARLHGSRNAKWAYSSLITGMDHNVGRIVSYLQRTKRYDNTLIIFTADQGWNAGQHGVWGKGNGTIPFNMFEQSIHVPMIWHHAARLPTAKTLNPMVSSYDFLPTLLDYLGIEAPRDPKRVGHSYAGFLRGETPQWKNRLYFEYCYVRGVRTENLKYIERTAEWPSELYDLEADPGEKRNLIDENSYAKRLRSLRADLAGFFERTGAPPIEDWRSTTEQHLTVYRR